VLFFAVVFFAAVVRVVDFFEAIFFFESFFFVAAVRPAVADGRFAVAFFLVVFVVDAAPLERAERAEVDADAAERVRPAPLVLGRADVVVVFLRAMAVTSPPLLTGVSAVRDHELPG